MKTININIPEGYEIDLETSDFANGEIAFKPVPKEWEDIGKSEYWFFTGSGTPVRDCDSHWLYSDAYPTKELLLAFEALRKLSFWRNKVWKKDGDWKPAIGSPEVKYSIFTHQGIITTGETYCTNPILSFSSEEIRDQFLHDHIALIKQAKILL